MTMYLNPFCDNATLLVDIPSHVLLERLFCGPEHSKQIITIKFSNKF